MTSEALPATPSHPAHSYATRIRQSVPTVRLRYDPDTLRAIKPAPIPRVDNELAPSDLAPFPSPNVVLHPDDANSKVFHAIARSLLAVVCLSSSTQSLFSRVTGQSGYDRQRLGRDVHTQRTSVPKVRLHVFINLRRLFQIQSQCRVASNHHVHARSSQALRTGARSTAPSTPHTFRHSVRRQALPCPLFHIRWWVPA